MPTQPHPVRPSPNLSTLPLPVRRPRLRPWPALAPQAQTQMAQHVARLVRRLRSPEEAAHADKAG